MSNPVYIATLMALGIWLAVLIIVHSDSLDHFLWNVLSAEIGLLLGIITYTILAPAAYAERGYFAIGGEGLLAYMIALFISTALIVERARLFAWCRKSARRARDSRRLRRG